MKEIWQQNVIYTDKLSERPFKTNDMKRILYHQQSLEEYKAEIENNVDSFMQTWIYLYVYEGLKLI